jgi:hypothetical protein
MVRWVLDAIVALGTIIALFVILWQFGVSGTEHLEERMLRLKMLGAFWALAPPLWFFLDWWWYKGPGEGAAYDHFKVSQDRAKDIWLGVGAAIAIFFFKGG